MLRPAPRSTLFPYTTLFRSDPHVSLDARRVLREMDQPDALAKLAIDALMLGMLVRVSRAHRDRKSTRLNSSHGYISYAVFCLKKKKQNNTLDHTASEMTLHT